MGFTIARYCFPVLKVAQNTIDSMESSCPGAAEQCYDRLPFALPPVEAKKQGAAREATLRSQNALFGSNSQ
jgi:hypothetical protein